MILYLVRHPRTVYGYEMCYGMTDVAVDADVMAEAVDRVRGLLPSDIPAAHWYSSPLTRAADMARGVAGGAVAPVLDDRLRELDFGEWELIPWNDLPMDEVMKWGDDFVATPAPGGESFLDLQNRAVSFASDLLSSGVERAVAFTHSGPIRALTAWALGMPLGNAFRIDVDFAGVLQMSLADDPVFNRFLGLW